MSGVEEKLDSFLLDLGLLDAIKKIAERLTPDSFLEKPAKVFNKDVVYLRKLAEVTFIDILTEDEQIVTLVHRILQAAHGKLTLKIRNLYEALKERIGKNPELLKTLSEDLLKIDASFPEAGETIQLAINRTVVASYLTIVNDLEDEEVLAAFESIDILMPKEALTKLDVLIERLQGVGAYKYKCAIETVKEAW